MSWDALHSWVGHAGPFALATIAALGILVLLHRRRAGIVAWLDARLPPGPRQRAVVMMALAAGTVGMFAKAAEDVANLESTEFDRAASLLLHRLDSPIMDAAMRIASALGSWPAIVVAIALTAAWCLVRRARLAASVLIGVVAGTEFLNLLLKHAFGRARPALFHEVPVPPSYSFPSGHTMMAAATYGIIAFVVSRELPAVRWRPFVAASALVFLVGMSRIFLGVHWATDVLGGLAGGTFGLLVGAVILEMSVSRRATRNGEPR